MLDRGSHWQPPVIGAWWAFIFYDRPAGRVVVVAVMVCSSFKIYILYCLPLSFPQKRCPCGLPRRCVMKKANLQNWKTEYWLSDVCVWVRFYANTICPLVDQNAPTGRNKGSPREQGMHTMVICDIGTLRCSYEIWMISACTAPPTWPTSTAPDCARVWLSSLSVAGCYALQCVRP